MLDFTCCEMSDEEQPPRALSSPSKLMREVQRVASKYGIGLSGENALLTFSRKAFERIVRVAKDRHAPFESFTFLRMTDDMLPTSLRSSDNRPCGTKVPSLLHTFRNHFFPTQDPSVEFAAFVAHMDPSKGRATAPPTIS